LLSSLIVRTTPRGVSLSIQVKLRASRSRVLGFIGEALSVALAAAPVDGAANEALRRVLSEYFGVPRSRVRIISGETHRRKVVELSGLDAAHVLARLAGLGEP
jgi:uncharacterized protein (TIGR00251 family)